ncbi:MAG: hypothetical protein LAT68_01185 [Cyclobacteriaceae bacterium]|nr:hypothetical protein [Cyclobacteriaceae bacterium]MCH8514916.1 hypothetical protein [Cyclobacteriaceae bacterium]
MRYQYTLYFLILMILLGSCTGKRRVLREGAELMARSNFKEAGEVFISHLSRRPQDSEIRAVLLQASQRYMQESENRISREFNRSRHNEVVYAFTELDEFVNRANAVGANLRIDGGLRRNFENSLDIFLDERYARGQALIAQGRFQLAEEVFSEVNRFQPGFRNTDQYLNKATNEPLYQSGNRHFNAGRFMDAFRDWKRADLDYKDVRDRMDQALNERYKEGKLFLMNENFRDAARAFSDVSQEAPNFLEVRSLLIEAVNEPKYRQAQIDLSASRCRTAFLLLEEVQEHSGGYKNSARLRSEALECARYPIAIWVEPSNQASAMQRQVENAIVEGILAQQSPFVEITNLGQVANRAVIGRSLSSATGLRGTQLNNFRNQFSRMNVRAVLFVDLQEVNTVAGRQQERERQGVEQVVRRSRAGADSIIERTVQYQEISQRFEGRINFTYRLVDVSSGNVLLQRTVRDQNQQDWTYARFRGNSRQLYPARVRNGVVTRDQNGFNQLQELLNRPAQIPTETLIQDLLETNALNVARELVSFNPDR